jgi:predicted RNase H-like HicB family nuclease
MEIVFTVTQEADGGFVAECLSHDIFTQGDSWEALRVNAQEAASAFFFDGLRKLNLYFLTAAR